MSLKVPFIVDPTNWGGQTYSPPLGIDIATLQNAIVVQLQSGFVDTPIQVFGYPDLPKDSWWNQKGRIGYVLVSYDSTEYSKPLATSAMFQEQYVNMDVLIMARQISWADFTSSGVYQAMRQIIKLSLTGFRVPGFRNLYFTGEHFRERDPQGRLWVYAMRLRCVTLELKNIPDVSSLLGKARQIIFMETGGQTPTVVPASAYTFVESIIQLPQINLSNVIVTNQSTGAAYIEGTDFTVQPAQGTITALSGGALSNGGTVNVAYTYSEVVGAPVPFPIGTTSAGARATLTAVLTP
ncbi:MAG: hypothetical protein KGL39_26675 [Patescibacteria group bacterium]|nr:hypothetical protein [Patescibacteria group bacterium]